MLKEWNSEYDLLNFLYSCLLKKKNPNPSIKAKQVFQQINQHIQSKNKNYLRRTNNWLKNEKQKATIKQDPRRIQTLRRKPPFRYMAAQQRVSWNLTLCSERCMEANKSKEIIAAQSSGAAFNVNMPRLRTYSSIEVFVKSAIIMPYVVR